MITLQRELLDYGYTKIRIRLRAISRNLVVLAETKNRAEGSNRVVVVSGLVAVTSFVAVTSRVTWKSVIFR